MRKLWLIIDADDTLWENNVYFEQAFEDFVELLDHSSLTAVEIREILDEIELASIKVNGYGSLNFGRNLQQCFRRLAERPWADDDLQAVMALAERILTQPVRLLEGVEETLAYLAERHVLTLCSKGHPEEQHTKIRKSGLQKYFTSCCVVKEKDTEAYHALVEQKSMDRAKTWMVGNSPKSDINPALEAGLGAVLVENPNTWSLEHELTPQPSERFRVIDKFSKLSELF